MRLLLGDNACCSAFTSSLMQCICELLDSTSSRFLLTCIGIGLSCFQVLWEAARTTWKIQCFEIGHLLAGPSQNRWGIQSTSACNRIVTHTLQCLTKNQPEETTMAIQSQKRNTRATEPFSLVFGASSWASSTKCIWVRSAQPSLKSHLQDCILSTTLDK